MYTFFHLFPLISSALRPARSSSLLAACRNKALPTAEENWVSENLGPLKPTGWMWRHWGSWLMALWDHAAASLIQQHHHHHQRRLSSYNTLTQDSLAAHQSQWAGSQHTEGNYYSSLFSNGQIVFGGWHPFLCSPLQGHCSNYSGRSQSCFGGCGTGRVRRAQATGFLHTQEKAKKRSHCI